MAAVELEELRRMVSQFRITELQVLLGYVGKQKTGKKQELMERALQLLRNPGFHLVSKIKELHSQRTLRGSNVSSLQRPPPSLHAYQPSNPEPPMSYNNYPKVDADHNLSLIPLPFYDHISQILPPTRLRHNNINNRYQEVMINFSLSPQHAKEITANRSVDSTGVYTSDVQVQLRFAPTDKETQDIKDMYPPCLVLRLNSKMIQLPNPIPTNKQHADPKRPPRPLDLTWSCRLTPMVQNALLICWALPNEPDIPKNYCYTINLVRKRSSEHLTQNVVARGIRPRRDTESLIKSKLSNEEDDIALTSLKVSLLCPLGKMRMSLPCCPTTCDHIQCFDARLYLMMNEKKPTWNCPVCDSTAKYEDLVVDELFMEICKIAGDCDEILFSPDGSWAPLGAPGKDAQTVNSITNGFNRSQSSSKVTTIAEHGSPVKKDDNKKEKSPDIDIIVLSDTDDDEASEDGSSIQPVKSNKRPISAISSDSSSLDLNSASSSINGPTSRPPDRPTIGNPPPLSNPSPHSLFNPPGVDTKHPYFFSGPTVGPSLSNFGSLMDSMNPSSSPATNSNPFTPPYPLFMPSSYLDYPQTSNYNGNHLNLFNLAPQDLSSRSSAPRFTAHQSIISEPTIIDFSPHRFDDSPLLDDSDIIPLD